MCFRGQLAQGKTTLVTQLCADPGINKAFNNNIIRFDLGLNPTDLLDQINEAALAFSLNWNFENSVSSALSQLFGIIASANTLIILDDVHTVEQALLFAPPTKEVFILIITRSQRLAKALHAQEITLSEFTLQEATQFINYRKIDASTTLFNLQNPVFRLPLVLYLLCECSKKGISLETLNKQLQEPNDLALNGTALEYVAYFWSVLLSETLSSCQHAVEALAIFPALTPLSYPIISQYWQCILKKPELEEENELFDELRSLQILNHRSLSNSASLSDVFVRFVEENTELDIQAYNQKFLDLYTADYIFDQPGRHR